MGLKSFARKVRGGTSSLPSNPEAERQQELARIDKEQARADKAQKKANGNKVLPVSASEEQEHRELSARIYAVERDMQEQRREVMKPRECRLAQSLLYQTHKLHHCRSCRRSADHRVETYPLVFPEAAHLHTG